MSEKVNHRLPSESPATVPVKERIVAPDILRLFACFSVISIHFFLNAKFYDEPIVGAEMMIMLVARLFFSTCVPLFIILTGYLSVYKPLSKKHYAKGMKFVWLYLLATLAVVIYRLYIKHSLPDWESVLWGTLRFNAAPYAWYVEMYLGLFLMIPFLNILFRSLPSKRWRLALILTCFVLSSLPKLVNVNNFVLEGWWQDPTSSTDYQRLIPQWWMQGYPIMFYFIGCYLREHGISWNKWIRRGLLVASLAAYTFYCLWRAHTGKFPWGAWTDWEFPLTVLSATLLASLMLDKQYRHMPKPLAKVIAYLSGLSLQIFLVSYIFDTEFYPTVIKNVPLIPDRIWSYFWVVPAVFFSSVALSIVIDLIYRLMMWVYRLFRDDIISSRKKAKQPHSGSKAAAEPPDSSAEAEKAPVPEGNTEAE